MLLKVSRANSVHPPIKSAAVAAKSHTTASVPTLVLLAREIIYIRMHSVLLLCNVGGVPDPFFHIH